MPVSLSEWRVRIGRYIQHPPDINKREMIERFLERWKEKKEKSKAAANQTGCHRTGSDQSSSVTQVLAEPLNLRRSCFYWYRPLGTSLVFGRYGKPSWSSVCQKTKVRKRKQSAQTPWLHSGLLFTITQVLTEPLDLVMSGLYWCQSLCNSLIFRRCCKSSKSSVRRKTKARKRKPSTRTLHISSVHISSITRVLAEPLNLRRSCLYWYRTEPMSLIFGDCCKPKSSVPSKTRVTTHKPSNQEIPSCSSKTSLMPPAISLGLNHLSSTTRVLAESLNWRRSFLYWYRPMGPSSVIKQYGRPAEALLPPKTKNFMPGPSCFSNGMSFHRSLTSYTVGGLCHFYLPMILLMRAGDIETNPGPEWTVSEEEFIKLSKLIEPSYYKEVGVHLDINIAELGQIIALHMFNYSDALLTVFTRWRDKQPPGTNIRALLAERLERSDLGSLAGKLLNGSLVPTRTGNPVAPPGPQTLPLSPELIKRCADDFKLKYRTTLCKIRADPLDPDSLVQFEDMYTNLVLEEEYRKSKRPLEYKDLFNLKVNGEFPRRLMIQGEAGAGKTTFCARIAWDWISGSPDFSKYVWVIVVPLREAKQYTIGEIAKSYLTEDNPATASQLTAYIRSNPREVFIAFDGLDEFSSKLVKGGKDGSKSECAQSPSTDQMQLESPQSTSATVQSSVRTSEACGSLSKRGEIANILRSDELAACPVMVTGRPWKVKEIRWDPNLRKLYTFIHVEGFSKENVEVYIHKYFQDDETSADQLILVTKDNDIISENMAPYPIYIAMLCLMWRELNDQKREEFKFLQTFSQIFDNMFRFLKVHYVEKEITDLSSLSFTDYVTQIEKSMQPVAKLAFTGLQENTLVFKEDDFQHCPESMQMACRVGILSQEKRLTSVYDKSNMYLQSTVSFPHKLFQEYMAGVYLASLYESDCNEFNKLMKEVVLPRKEEFRYLLYFTVSRNKTIANHIMKCIVLDNMEMEKGMDLLVDVALESQDPDAAGLLRDRASSEMMRIYMRGPTAHTVAGYLFTGIYEHVVALLVWRRECGRTMSHDVAEIICCAPSLHFVHLINVSFHIDFFAVLAKEGKKSKVQSVYLSEVKCPTAASSQNLAEALCSMPNLTRLELHGVDLSEEFCATLKGKALTLHVQSVSLSEVKCPTAASSQNLAEALCFMPNLTRLELDGVDLSEEFYATLKGKALTLHVQSVYLWKVKCPTAASSQNLAEALCSMPNLTGLELDAVDLSEEFCATLKRKALTLHVHSLLLRDLKCLTACSSQNLAEALCSMPELTDLKLETVFHEDLHDFAFTLTAKASSTQGCFPQISEGIFLFNEAHQETLDSFLCSLADFSRLHPSTSQPSDQPQQQTVYKTEQSLLSENTSETIHQGTEDQLSHTSSGGCSSTSRSRKRQAPCTQSAVPEETSGILEKQVRFGTPMECSSGRSLVDYPSSDDSDNGVHSARSISQLSDYPSQQPMGDVDSSYQVHPPRRTSQPSDHHQQRTVENVLLSLPSVYPRGTTVQDLGRAIADINGKGGKLSVESYGFELSIPPGALEDGSSEQIRLEVLTSMSKDIILNRDELIVSRGYKCYPSGLHFKKPVQLIIPHCAVFSDPSKVQVVLISPCSQNAGKVLRTPLTQSDCVVKREHFDLSLEHFCGGFLAVIYNWLFVKGKNMLCMPYLPKRMPTERKPILEFCLWNKLNDPASWKACEEDISQHVKDRADEIFVSYKDLEVTCQLDAESTLLKQIIPYDELFTRNMTKHQLYFNLDLSGRANDTSITLTLLQDNISIRDIKFHTRFAADAEGGALSSADHADDTEPPRTVSQSEYHRLSCDIALTEYSDVGINLGMSHVELQKILRQKNNDYTAALMEVFMKWNNQQNAEETNIRKYLADTLFRSGLNDLSNKLRKGCLVSK